MDLVQKSLFKFIFKDVLLGFKGGKKKKNPKSFGLFYDWNLNKKKTANIWWTTYEKQNKTTKQS